ncbi:type IV pilus modification protein PilV [Pseudomonas sp. Marseille-QA0892]
MIEVLITLVLISIGVLGMVALQGRTIQYTQDATQRNVAASLANDLVELMRARPEGLPESSGFYKAKGAAFPARPASCMPLPSETEEQLGCWAAKVQQSLPGVTDLMTSDFYICRSKTRGTCTADGNAIEIRIAWTARSGECAEASSSEGSTCSYVLRSQL